MNGEPDRLAIIEALLFAAEDPLSAQKIQEILTDADVETTEAALRELALRLEADGRGVMVQEVAGGFRLATRPDVHTWVQRLQQVKPARLSRAALETLAIVAYRQPITRAEIEAIRGVAVDGVMRTLLERELVRMMGRKPDAGRPMLYGTSQQFLEHFGLRNLGDLPTLREINELIGITDKGADTAATVEGAPVSADSDGSGGDSDRGDEPRVETVDSPPSAELAAPTGPSGSGSDERRSGDTPEADTADAPPAQ